jgi:hypothetical protein
MALFQAPSRWSEPSDYRMAQSSGVGEGMLDFSSQELRPSVSFVHECPLLRCDSRLAVPRPAGAAEAPPECFRAARVTVIVLFDVFPFLSFFLSFFLSSFLSFFLPTLDPASSPLFGAIYSVVLPRLSTVLSRPRRCRTTGHFNALNAVRPRRRRGGI